jgi:Protein of unknown function (DUF1064)
MKPSKYRNIKTIVDGLSFDSKAEAKRWHELKLLERAAELSKLERQVRFDFKHNGVNLGFYKADFTYFTKQKFVVEDVKGYHTSKLAPFRMKVKMMKAFYSIDVQVVL